MKAKLEKVIYMSLGALIALLGYMLGTLNSSINAQSETKQTPIDEIIVQKLRIVDIKGNTIAVLGEQEQSKGKRIDILQVYDAEGNIVLHFGQTPNGGIIDIHGKNGDKAVLLDADVDGGNVVVFGKDGIAALQADVDGGNVVVFGKDGNAAVELKADANDGSVTVLGKDRGRGALSTTVDGGRLELSDKNENVKVVLGSTAKGGSVTVVGEDNKSAATLRSDATVVKIISEQRRRKSIRPPTIH